MRQQQHCTGYTSNARSCLNDLQCRTKYIACGVACTCQLTVSITILNNQTAQIERINYQLTSFFDSHAFFLAKFTKQLRILLFLRMILRIDDCSLADVSKSPFCCTSINFIRITQKNQVSNSVCQNLIGSFQGAFFRSFRKNNTLAVGFRTLNDFIN